MLADFLAHPDAQKAQLTEAHVLALRLYSTAAFLSLNGPLRNLERTGEHPFAATVFFLADGIKRLRAVHAPDATTKGGSQGGEGGSVDLWRGMRDLASGDAFLNKGGAEPSLMSTTSDLSVALCYGLSRHTLLFKIQSSSFMECGVSGRC